mgnify:FL=1
MGSVRATISLSTTNVMPTPVNVGANITFNADGGAIGRAKVLKTAVHNNALDLYVANDKLVTAYLYVRNLEAEKENFVYVYNNANSNDVVAKLGGGEFCFVPVAADQNLKCYATKVDSVVEFAVFGLDSSAAGPFIGSGD